MNRPIRELARSSVAVARDAGGAARIADADGLPTFRDGRGGADGARGSFRGSWAPANCFSPIQGTVEADAKTVFLRIGGSFLPHPLKKITGWRYIRGLFRLLFLLETKNRTNLKYSKLKIELLLRFAPF